MSLIHLIRHGRTEANRKHLYCGSTDVPLDAQGISELEALRAKGGYPEIQGALTITSGLLRTQETFEVLFGGSAEISEPDLQEMDFGAFEMRSYEQMKNEPEYIAWITDETGGFVCPGGESSNAFCQRVCEAFDRIAKIGGDCVIVCHGGVISRIMERLFPEKGLNFYEWQPDAGCGYTIINAGDPDMAYMPLPRTDE